MVVLSTNPDIAPRISQLEQDEYRSYLVEVLEPLAGHIEDSELRFYDNGYRKAIFEAEPNLLRRSGLVAPESATCPEHDEIVIVGMPFSAGYDLHREYQLLCELHEREGTTTPYPVFFHDSYASENRVKMIGMEKVPGVTLQDYHEHNVPHPDLGLWQARAAALVHARTGLIYAEPHGKNILVDEEDERVRFVDVIHFQHGTLDEMLEIWLDDWIDHHPELRTRSDQRSFIAAVHDYA